MLGGFGGYRAGSGMVGIIGLKGGFMLYVGDVIRRFGEVTYYRVMEVAGGGRISDALKLSDGRIVSELSVEIVRGRRLSSYRMEIQQGDVIGLKGEIGSYRVELVDPSKRRARISDGRTIRFSDVFVVRTDNEDGTFMEEFSDGTVMRVWEELSDGDF